MILNRIRYPRVEIPSKDVEVVSWKLNLGQGLKEPINPIRRRADVYARNVNRIFPLGVGNPNDTEEPGKPKRY